MIIALIYRYTPSTGYHFWQVAGLLHENFQRLPWNRENSWPEANLDECMLYLRRSVLINIPQEWKTLIPSNLAELDRLRGQ